MVSLARMDYDDLVELEEALSYVIETRKTEEKFDLEGMDRAELEEARRCVSEALDEMDAAEEREMNAQYFAAVM